MGLFSSPFFVVSKSTHFRTKEGANNHEEIWLSQHKYKRTKQLKEYMIKEFTIDDERLKGNGGGNYWKELLDRIRDIRSSEKVLYRQVLDLYARV